LKFKLVGCLLVTTPTSTIGESVFRPSSVADTYDQCTTKYSKEVAIGFTLGED